MNGRCHTVSENRQYRPLSTSWLQCVNGGCLTIETIEAGGLCIREEEHFE